LPQVTLNYPLLCMPKLHS